MEDEITQQTEGYEKDEVEELIFDRIRVASLTAADAKLLVQFPNLNRLSFNGVGLKSLANFPALDKLATLELNDNKLSGDFKPLTQCTNLMTVSLGGNPIKEVSHLDDLTPLENLLSLDLFECPVTKIDDYTNSIFEAFPNLAALDGKDKDGNEVDLEDEAELEDDEDDDEEGDEDDEDDEEVDDEDEDEDGEDDEDDEDEEQYEEGEGESDDDAVPEPSKKKQKTK